MKNSKMYDGRKCVECGWKVVHCLCNGEMSEGVWGEWDWWVYCSNKGCKNHEGEGVFQNTVKWIEKVENE